LELLRKEVDILKLQVDLMQEKLRAQGEELRALRGAADAAKARQQEQAELATFRLRLREKLDERIEGLLTVQPDAMQALEAALKALREATDEPARRRAADDLEKAVKKLREQPKPADPTAPQKKR
jgi:hypothetical protein